MLLGSTKYSLTTATSLALQSPTRPHTSNPPRPSLVYGQTNILFGRGVVTSASVPCCSFSLWFIYFADWDWPTASAGFEPPPMSATPLHNMEFNIGLRDFNAICRLCLKRPIEDGVRLSSIFPLPHEIVVDQLAMMDTIDLHKMMSICLGLDVSVYMINYFGN